MARLPKYSTEDLRRLAARARAATERPHFDPIDRDQLRCFAEWFDGLAVAREGEDVVREGESACH
jgi:hypothetical protein